MYKMSITKVLGITGVGITVALSLTTATPTLSTTTISNSNENGEQTNTSLTWWQILLLVIGGFLVFTCWGCYFFLKHREKQQAKFKPIATSNGDDPRVRSDSNTVEMEPPRASADEQNDDVEIQLDASEQPAGHTTREDSDKRIVAQDEIVIENVDERQLIASTSDYQYDRRDTAERVAMDDLEYQ
ncbi:uncharacterized protein [Antedon mediterranea]|uniref:uncharacterized protein n=1 Tax=Antedon mediterranea TaxID=105859 RepID=UPI003AF93716